MADYTILANDIAGSYGIPANIFGAVIQKESNWDLNAQGMNTNGSVDYGLGQINSKTAASMGLDPQRLLTDAGYNLKAAASILSDNFKRFGNWAKALSAYNTGKPDSMKGTIYASDVMRRAGEIDENGLTIPPGSDGGFELTNPDTWLASIGDAVKPYIAAIGLVALALLLIGAGTWKAIK